MSPLLLEERDGQVATLTLNRPERHNSLVPELLEAMLDALAGLAAYPDLRAVVLQANGPSFSTGGDVRRFHDQLGTIEEYAGRIVGLLNRVVLAMISFPVPVVSAVQGMVTGGSLGLVVASDIVLLGPRASFTPYYGVVGFSPDGGWTALLPALIGPRRAAEALLLNRTIGAEEAVLWGLATRLVEEQALRQEAQVVAAAIAGMQRGSVRRSKTLLAEAMQGAAAGLRREYEHFLEQIVSPEARLGMADFLGEGEGDG
ncbi:MAG: enoyl-CoA hydratase/isomerase family protein [Trueperaceae bacterium]